MISKLEKYKFYFLLFAFLLLAFAFSSRLFLSPTLFNSVEVSFTLDKIEKGPYLTWTDLIGDYNPPTFFLFFSFFSKDLFGVLLVSFFAALIGVFVVFRALSSKFDQTLVFLGLLFFIFSPLGNYYLFVIRPAPFSFLFSALVLFFYAGSSDEKRFSKMIVASALATYFSYLNFFLLLAVLLICVLERAPLKNYFFAALAIPSVAMAFIHYPYMEAGHWDTLDAWSSFQNISIHSNFVSGLLSLTALSFLVPLITLVVLFLVRKGFWGDFKVQVLYIVLLALAGLRFPTAYFPRYFFPSLFFLYLLFAFRVKNKPFLYALAVLFVALSIVNYFRLYARYGIAFF